MNSRLKVLGWREWIGLPQLGIKRIKAKVDTGARSCSLHAFDLEIFEKENSSFVRFKVHPIQRSDRKTVEVESRVVEFREIRSSNGQTELRPVIETEMIIFGVAHRIELTLADRNQMGFRMLVGRRALKDKFLVDAGRSYYGGRPPKKKNKKLTPTRKTTSKDS